MAGEGRRLWGGRVCCVAVVAAVASISSTASADPPELKAKRAQAAEVLREISALDERLSALSERYDGARVHLQAVEERLSSERISLKRARKQYRRALSRVARLLVSLYTNGSSSSLDAILGARSVEEMLSVVDAQAAIARERNEVATSALAGRQRVHASIVALQAGRADAARSVTRLAQTRRTVEQGLVRRQRLLASVRAEIAQLRARERLRQQRLLAAARARLAAVVRAARERATAARTRAAAKAAAQRPAAPAARADPSSNPTLTGASAATSQPAVPQPPVTTTHVATTTASAPIVATPTNATPTVSQPAPLPPPASVGHQQAAEIALGYVGIPYRWGGATPAGFDCSGLVSYVYAQLGIQLPHYAEAQFGYGSPVTREQLQPGDLVFFDNLAHVGIYIGANEFVHAPHTGTVVSIDSLDEPWYSRYYVGARRI